MPLTLKQINESGRLGDLIATVGEFFLDSTDADQRKQSIVAIQEAADMSALVGPNMMRVVSNLQRQGWVKSGLYKALVEFDRQGALPKDEKKSAKKPKEPVPKVAGVPHVTDPPAAPVVDNGVLPMEKLWRNGSKGRIFHTALEAKPSTRDELVAALAELGEKKVDELIRQYRKGQYAGEGWLLVEADGGILSLTQLVTPAMREAHKKK